MALKASNVMLIFLQTIKKILLKIKLHTTRCSRTAIEICQESETNTRILFFFWSTMKRNKKIENTNSAPKTLGREGNRLSEMVAIIVCMVAWKEKGR